MPTGLECSIKYKSLDATVVVTGEENKDKLLAQGHKSIPSKRGDTTKNMHENHQPDFVPMQLRHALWKLRTG